MHTVCTFLYRIVPVDSMEMNAGVESSLTKTDSQFKRQLLGIIIHASNVQKANALIEKTITILCNSWNVNLLIGSLCSYLVFGGNCYRNTNDIISHTHTHPYNPSMRLVPLQWRLYLSLRPNWLLSNSIFYRGRLASTPSPTSSSHCLRMSSKSQL